MSSPDPAEPSLIGPLPRERPIAWQVAASVALHAAVLLLLLLPALRDTLDAPPPAAIDVELVVPSSEPSSVEPPSIEPSAEGSSEEPPSAEPSAVPASELSSAEETSSVPSVPEQPSETASSAEAPPSAEPQQARAQPVAPVPMTRPVTIATGRAGDVATDASSAEPDGALELTVETGDEAAGDASSGGNGDADEPVAQLGELHVAENFYLAQILDSAAMAKAREALDNLPRDKRLSQTCNIEAIGQVANAGQGFSPDAVIVDAFSKSTIAGTRLTAAGAIFRSAQKWYALAFDCTLSGDLTEVTAFTFRLGPDVTSLVTKAAQ